MKWALLYGVILCMARAFGEFGAVSVVSGHIDVNDTMPLRIEKLWNEYNNQAAFSVASVLAFLAVVHARRQDRDRMEDRARRQSRPKKELRSHDHRSQKHLQELWRRPRC